MAGFVGRERSRAGIRFDIPGRSNFTAPAILTRRFRRDAALAVVGSLAVVLLAGCSMSAPKSVPFPASSDLVGQWSSSSEGGSLELNSSGTLVMKNVPRGVLEHDSLNADNKPTGPGVGGTGTWHLDGRAKESGALDGAPIVDLLFSKSNPYAYGLDVYVSGNDKSRALYVPDGDPDLDYQYVFHRR
jgi:hypothetical protein